MKSDDLRVVIVDDSRDFLDALALLLELDGYFVKTATNSADALALIADFHPVCVLTDINMDGIGGVELAAHLRAQYGQGIVLIAITGWGNPDDRVSKEFERFDFYLRKPIDMDRLRLFLPPVSERSSQT